MTCLLKNVEVDKITDNLEKTTKIVLQLLNLLDRKLNVKHLYMFVIRTQITKLNYFVLDWGGAISHTVNIRAKPGGIYIKYSVHIISLILMH